jgi:hypothetical protein
MIKITAVRALPKFKIWIKFQDGQAGTVDLSDLAGKGVFSKWNEPGFFDAVFIDQETHAVAWPGGIDLCPDSLYEDVTGKSLFRAHA